MTVEEPLQKFRPRCAQRLAEILKPDALGEDTRRQILRNMGTGIAAGPTDGEASGNSKTSAGANTEGNYSATLRSRVASANSELLTALTHRLKMLEAQQHAYRLELKEKTEKLARMQTECEAEKSRREEAETLVVELFNDKEELEKQIKEMKDFLADYGLEWVGNVEASNTDSLDANPKQPTQNASAVTASETPQVSNGEPKRFNLYAGDYIGVTSPSGSGRTSPTAGELCAPKTPQAQGGSSLPVSMEILQKNARILSDYVGFKEVVADGKKGSIKERDVVRVVVYKDGICVNSGPFRPFGWPLCDAVLNDIADGYYPYEFKQRYPEGFPIEIVDQTSVQCNVAAAGAKSNNGVKGVEHVHGGYQTVTREEFVRKLPATRITTGGRVVDVQGEIAKIIGCGKGKSNDGDAPVRHISLAERKKTGKVGNHEGGEDSSAIQLWRVEGMIALQLRFPCGKRLVLNLLPESTVGDLRREVQLAIPSLTVAYSICLPFPTRTLDDDTKTLTELGISTACALMVQPHKEVRP